MSSARGRGLVLVLVLVLVVLLCILIVAIDGCRERVKSCDSQLQTFRKKVGCLKGSKFPERS